MPTPPALLTDESAEGILIATLNRPDKLNALNMATMDLLTEAVLRFRDSPELKVMLIRAEGRYFSAGADLKGGLRKLVRVSEVLGTDPSPYDVRDVYGYRQTGVIDGSAVGEFYATGYRPRVLERFRAMGVDLPDELFRERVWSDA